MILDSSLSDFLAVTVGYIRVGRKTLRSCQDIISLKSYDLKMKSF